MPVRWRGHLSSFPMVRVAIISALALMAFTSACMRLIIQSTRPSPMSREADRAQLLTAMRIIAKSIVIIEPALPKVGHSEYANAMSRLDDLLRSIVKSGDADALRAVGILYGYLGMQERANECLNEFIRLKEAGGGITEGELKLWRRMLMEKPVALDELKTLERGIDGLQLGWLGQVAKAWLYERAFMFVQSERMKSSLRASAIRSLLPLFLLLMVVGMFCLVGIVLSPVLLILLFRGLRLRRRGTGDVSANPHLLFEAFAVYLFLMEIVTPMVVRALPHRVAAQDVTVSLIAVMIANEAISALSILWLAMLLYARSSNMSAVGLKVDAIAKDLLHGFITYISMLPWVWLASALSMLISKWLFGRLSEPAHPIAQVMMFASSKAFIITVFLTGVLAAPVIEELIFRGALYSALRQRMGVLSGAVLSSLLFAILHPQSIVGVPPLFIVGIALSLLYELRRSVIGCIFAHALINFFSLLILTLLTSL
ncbi:MAG: hypothetical protein GDYSWBUE_001906 [Candidatus Fervidibacterota bacterium]